MADAHGKHIARRTVKYAVRRRSQQQGQTVATVAADDDQVHGFVLGDVVDLGLGPTEHQVPTVFGNADADSELRQLGRSLLVNLILHRGQVHRHVTPVDQAQRLDDVNDVHFGVGRFGQGHGPLGHPAALLGQIDRKKNATIVAHVRLRYCPW